MEIDNHKHLFTIEEKEIELTINCKNGYWTSHITKGETGTRGCYGGRYDSLKEYIADQEKEHRYSFNFGKYGYTHAKTVEKDTAI